MHSNPTRRTMRSNSDWAKLTPNWGGTKMPKIRCENPFRYFRNESSLTTGWGKFCCASEKPKKVARSWPWLSSCSRLNESERLLPDGLRVVTRPSLRSDKVGRDLSARVPLSKNNPRSLSFSLLQLLNQGQLRATFFGFSDAQQNLPQPVVRLDSLRKYLNGFSQRIFGIFVPPQFGVSLAQSELDLIVRRVGLLCIEIGRAHV